MAIEQIISGFSVKPVKLAGRIRYAIRVTFNVEGLRSVQAVDVVYLDNRDEAFSMMSAVTPFKPQLAEVWTKGTEQQLELLREAIKDAVWAAYVDRFMPSSAADGSFLDVGSDGRIVQ